MNCISKTVFALSLSTSIAANAEDISSIVKSSTAGAEEIITAAGKAIRMNNILCRPIVEIDNVDLMQNIVASGDASVDEQVIKSNCGDLTIENTDIYQDIVASDGASVNAGLF